jgi:hypothetical protein
VSDIVFSFSVSCVAEWLAGIPASDHVNWFDFRPVNLGDVPKVGDVGVMVCEDLAGCWFNLCIPRKVTTNGDV